jgi:S-adenosylmethionine:tRNA ribosyltransferase-isomerase
MQRADFGFDLPLKQIAQQPLPNRTDSRLLVLDRADGDVFDRTIPDLVELLREGDLLVFNDTRVISARLFGTKVSGGRVEVLVDRLLGAGRILAQVRASRAPRIGTTLQLPGEVDFVVVARHGRLFELTAAIDVLDYLELHGEVPLPPYIQRLPNADDVNRYQTVFARNPGAVAAPTAGLHFDESLLTRLRQRGVVAAYVTLHVGAGTFAPVPEDVDIESHRLHSEWLQVGDDVCAAVAAARSRGGRVIAVGTTSVRALEAASDDTGLVPFSGETDLFIYPGYRFKVVDAMLTNFHLPESSLLMLVAAFAGRDQVLGAYAHAVSAGYRFFSYGDAMFVADAVAP